MLAIIMSMVCTKTWAYDAEIDGIYYNFSESGATVVSDAYGSYEGNIIIPETVSYDGKTYDVTAIEKSAFYSCSGLTTVVVGNGVTSIGDRAFNGCSALTAVTIGSCVTSVGRRVFEGCANLTSLTFHCKEIGSWFQDMESIKDVVIGEKVTSIGERAFSGCSGLTAVDIPNNVTSIGGAAFAGCSNLSTVNIPDKVTTIGSGTFSGCSSLDAIEIPNTITSIGSSAFQGCSALTVIDIPNSVTSIGSSAFYGCSSLNTIEIPNSVTTIDDFTFYECSSLSTVSIGSSVTSIAERAFSGCESLTSLTFHCPDVKSWFRNYNIEEVIIGEEVLSIGDGAFQGCSSLTTLSIGNGVTSIGNYAFSGCGGLSTMSIGNGVTSIGENAFQNCSGLTSLSIGNGVTSIGKYAFSGCSGIINITLSEGLQTIGSEAFQGTGLTTLTIPSTVTEIGVYALVGKTIYCNAPAPPAATSSLAYNANKITLYVPQGSEKAYSNASYWKEFFIVETGTTDWTEGTVTITVETPGQLRMSIVELDEDQVTRLVVKGSINSADLKYLNERTGKLSELESLDLSDVTLVYDDECYSTHFIKSDVSFSGGTYYYYYLSATERMEHWTSGMGIGGSSYHYAYYGNQLAGAFYGLPLKHVVMPKSVTKVARETFSGCSSLQNVEFPGGVSQIDDMAFSGCSRLRSFDVSQSDSIGVSAFYNCMSMAEIDGLEHVKYIGRDAFNGCATLKGNASGVLALEQVDSIPEQTFYGCSMLSTIRLSDKLYSLGQRAFSGCASLTAIQLPESLTVLLAEVFADCNSLQQVSYSASLLQVDAESFKNSAWMNSLPIENGIKYMGHIALSYDRNSDVAATSPATLTFREGTTTIADRFSNTMPYEHKNNVTALAFPSTLLRIGDQAFYRSYYDTSLPIASLSLPESLEEIGAYAFANAASLTKLTLPESLKRIGDGAFSECQKLAQVVYHTKDAESLNLFANCKSLEKVTIGAKVQRLPDGIFSGCTNLLIVQSDERTDDTPLEIGASAFYNCTTLTRLQLPASTSAIGAGAFGRCTSLSSFKIPQRVTTISSNMFNDCTGLTTVQLHENVRIIGDNAFSGCENISAITLPEGLDSIGSYAFSGCYGLTELTIPASVKHLGNDFLNDCYNLATLTSHVTTPQPLSGIIPMSNRVLTEIYGYTDWGFYYNIHYDEMTLYVPDGCKSRYQNTSGWNLFKHIEELGGGDVTALNKVTATDVSITQGMTAELSVGLQNVIDDFTAYQFDLVLPRGIEICTDAQGKYEVEKGDRYADEDQVLMAEKVLDNPYLSTVTYRIVCMSMKNAVITGTDGPLLSIKLRCFSNKAEGDYQAMIENVTFTQVDETENRLDQRELTITVNKASDFDMGDVNGDGIINTTDVVAVVNYIVGAPNGSFNVEAADMNGDGVVNITDVVAIIALIME